MQNVIKKLEQQAEYISESLTIDNANSGEYFNKIKILKEIFEIISRYKSDIDITRNKNN